MTLRTDLIVRPYQEVVDDVLVAMTGGVVNEELLFDVREASYPLAQPARDVRGLTGVVDDQPYYFQAGIDWRFDRAQNAVVFLERGKKPDRTSPVFYVDYFLAEGAESPLTDLNVGSVTRTIAEAMSRELALLYRQVNLAYQSGFIDLAAGTALDFVVAILDVQRKRGDFAQGMVTFFRTVASRGNITVPQGTRLITADGVIFETTSERTLQRGQVRIDIPVRAAEAFKGPAGKVEASTITSLIVPVEGIERVTNFDPTQFGGPDESDADLRARAKAKLRALSLCTVDALLDAAREAGAANAEVVDPMTPAETPEKWTDPGTVVMVVEVDPLRFDGVRALVNARRAAGVAVRLVARYVFIHPRLRVALRRNLTQAGRDQVRLDMIAAMTGFVAGLGSGMPVPLTRPAPERGILEVIAELPDVRSAELADLLVWRTVVERDDQIGQRLPAPELIVGADGTPVSPDHPELATQVMIDARFWPVIEVEPADIQLLEP